jgi:hypothetical protein
MKSIIILSLLCISTVYALPFEELTTTVDEGGNVDVTFAEPVDEAYTNAYLASLTAPDAGLLSVKNKLFSRFTQLDDDEDCPKPTFLSKFLWDTVKPGIYNGTLCTVLTKQSLGTPSSTFSCRPFKFGTKADHWVMKYPPTGTTGQHQYVRVNESLVYDVAPNRCSFVENGWRYTDQVRGWNAARYDPIGKKELASKDFTYSGTASDIGSCGFYVSVRPKLQCKMEDDVATNYFLGTAFSQTIISRPSPSLSIAIDVHGIIDVTLPNGKADYKDLSTEPNFFDAPAVCDAPRNTMRQYCAATNPLSPDARALLIFK